MDWDDVKGLLLLLGIVLAYGIAGGVERGLIFP